MTDESDGRRRIAGAVPIRDDIQRDDVVTAKPVAAFPEDGESGGPRWAGIGRTVWPAGATGCWHGSRNSRT